jgi:hypothetical protein
MDKLIESITKVIEAIFSSKLLWLIIVALAILGVIILSVVSDGDSADFWGMKELLGLLSVGSEAPGNGGTVLNKPLVGLVTLGAIALILAKVVLWIAQREELVEILTKIVQSILTAKTFWLIVMAVALFGLATLVANAISVETKAVEWSEKIPLAAMALILAKVVLWTVDRVIDQYFA